jgi:phage-related protein
MINKRHLFVRNAVAVLAATPLLWIAPGVYAQTSSPTPQESQSSQNNDVTHRELVRFDLFLDNHQDIDQALRRDPSLVNESSYLQAHPDLQTFLQEHPAIREEIKENPNYFMRQENRYEQREDARALAQFDQFLDSHRDIAEQLRRDPSLANNKQYVDSHPALQAFLQQHTEVRQDLSRNPNGYMQQINQYESRENPNSDLVRNRVDNRQDNDTRQDRDRDMDRRETEGQDRDRDSDRRDEDRRAQLAQFDRFLDTHRETAERLRRDPSLVKNQQFLQTHPALQTYLQQHPDVQQRLDQNPNAFMRQENRFDANEDARNRDFDRDDVRRNNDRDDMRARDNDRRDADNRRDNDNRQSNDNRQDVRDRDADNRNDNRQDNDYRQDTRNRDRDHGQVVSFDQFLDKHREIAEQLRRDPSLAKNQQFVQNHPALQAYLQDHQGVREELNQNPNAFMQAENRYESRENGMGNSGMNREQHSFGQFLGTHSSMSQELSKNPSLLKNREYMSSHPELDAYLKAHPDAQSQMAKDPDAFLKASQQFSSTAKTGTTTTTGTTGTTGSSATKTATPPSASSTTPPSTSSTNTTKPPKQ